MAVSDVELGDKFAGVLDTARITLNLNDRYILSSRIAHNLAYEWGADLSRFGQALEMQTINVKQGFLGTGEMTLKGKLTNQVQAIGDVSIALNGAQKDYKLMKTPHFMRRVKNKQSIRYKDATGTLAANLKNDQWAITANTKSLGNPRPMYHGDANLKVKIGGKDYFSAYVHPDSYVVRLKYQKQRK